MCHSPWLWVNQNILCYGRGFIFVYLLVLLGMPSDYKFTRDDKHTHWLVLFQFSTVTILLLLAYHTTAFVWKPVSPRLEVLAFCALDTSRHLGACWS